MKSYKRELSALKLKESYIEKKHELDKLKEVYDKLLHGYAKQAVEYMLEKDPTIICLEGSYNITNYKRLFNDGHIKKALSDARYEVLLGNEDADEMSM